jgi:uncharacterized protein Usg
MEETKSYSDSLKTGKLGILHLYSLWSRKVVSNKTLKTQNDPILNQLDYFVLDALEIPIAKATEYLLSIQPDFKAFEEWIRLQHEQSKNPTPLSSKLINTLNQAVQDFIQDGSLNYPLENDANRDPIFTPKEIEFWHENGYIILRDAVDKEECKTLESAVWDYLDLSPDAPETWHTAKDQFWLKEFDHPLIHKNRANKKIIRAYAQLWGSDRLFQSTNRISFNPPQDTLINAFGPSSLHWDISLAQPIPFDLFGMLYLNDIDANQGAFQCIPGFHKKIDVWLENLPQKRNPREEILKQEYQQAAIKVPANRGDLIICSQKLPHSSSVNRGSYPRFVQYIAMYPPNRTINPVWK